jgi:biotin carboxyl carrier protein
MAGQFIKKEKETSKNHFNQIVSPLFGKVTDIKVSENDFVKKGDILLTIESMKTENHILSPGEGIVTEIKVFKGMQVEENFELITLNPVFENEYISNRKTS